MEEEVSTSSERGERARRTQMTQIQLLSSTMGMAVALATTTMTRFTALTRPRERPRWLPKNQCEQILSCVISIE